MTGKHRASRKSFRILITVLMVAAAAGVAVALLSTGEREPAAARPGSPIPTVGESVLPPTGTPSEPEPKPKPEPEPKGELLIHAAGDTNLDPNYISTYRSQGYGYAWSGLGGLFERDDLTIVNLECAVSNKGSAVPKEFNFRGDPRALPFMRRAGVEVASLANNHSYDFGPDALVDTVKNVEEAGITPVGAGADQAAATEPAIFKIKGWIIAVVAWDAVVDPYPTAVATRSHPGTAFGHDFNAVVRTVKKVSRKADITIVQVHWGVELDTRPESYQVPQGHKLIDVGADVIFGGHSHRLQPVEYYKGKPIFWSLGNFVWPNFSAAGSTTGIAEVTVKPNGTIKAKLLPAYITAPGHPELR